MHSVMSLPPLGLFSLGLTSISQRRDLSSLPHLWAQRQRGRGRTCWVGGLGARNGSCPCWPHCASGAVLGTSLPGSGPSQHWGQSLWASPFPREEMPLPGCPGPWFPWALPPWSPSPEPGANSPLCLAVELDRSLGHQEPPWKEFRFDLTQIPAGEAVTAAEFRIYKLPSTHLLNRTLHVSMFEVVRERANRCLPTPASRSNCGCVGPALGGRTWASWEHTLQEGDAWPKALAPWLQSPPWRPGCETLDGSLSSQASVSPLSTGAAAPFYSRCGEMRQ